MAEPTEVSIPVELVPSLSVDWEPDFEQVEEVLLGKIEPAADDPRPVGLNSNVKSAGRMPGGVKRGS